MVPSSFLSQWNFSLYPDKYKYQNMWDQYGPVIPGKNCLIISLSYSYTSRELVIDVFE